MKTTKKSMIFLSNHLIKFNFVGRPALFFGAELNGLFSAQVVPNDEVVLEEGKKSLHLVMRFTNKQG
ncbi:MAG: hypothetical protein R2837_09600 [Aliarcobacter sp.]